MAKCYGNLVVGDQQRLSDQTILFQWEPFFMEIDRDIYSIGLSTKTCFLCSFSNFKRIKERKKERKKNSFCWIFIFSVCQQSRDDDLLNWILPHWETTQLSALPQRCFFDNTLATTFLILFIFFFLVIQWRKIASGPVICEYKKKRSPPFVLLLQEREKDDRFTILLGRIIRSSFSPMMSPLSS